jgi:hypothetical protein
MVNKSVSRNLVLAAFCLVVTFCELSCSSPLGAQAQPNEKQISTTGSERSILVFQKGVVQSAPTIYANGTPSTPSRLLHSQDADESKIEVSGIAERVSLPTRAVVGQGFSRIGGSARGFAFNPKSTRVTTTTENAITYDFKFVDSADELARALKLDARASYSGFTGGVSASMSLFQSADFSSTNAYGVAKITVVTGTQAIQPFILSDEALKKLTNELGTQDFISTYGDAFLQQLVLGAELCALIEFSSMSEKERRELQVDISGSYGGFSAESSFRDSMQKLSKKRNVRVLYSQTGAATGRKLEERTKEKDTPSGKENVRYAETGGVLAMSPEEFVGRVREFPTEARENVANSTILWAELLDYNVVENRPPRTRIPLKLDVKWALENIGRVKLLVDGRKDSLRGKVASGRISGNDQKIATEIEIPYLRYVSQELDRIGTSLMAVPSSITVLNTLRVLNHDEYVGAHFGGVLAPTCPIFQPFAEAVTTCLYGSTPFEPVPIKVSRATFSGQVPIAKSPGADTYPPEVELAACFTPQCDDVFSKPPHVTAVAQTVASRSDRPPHSDSYVVVIVKVTNSGFTFRVRRTDQPAEHPYGAYTVYWIAHEAD